MEKKKPNQIQLGVNAAPICWRTKDVLKFYLSEASGEAATAVPWPKRRTRERQSASVGERISRVFVLYVKDQGGGCRLAVGVLEGSRAKLQSLDKYDFA